MTRFVLVRLTGLVVVLLAMTALVFLLRQVVPGDPARAAAGPNAPAEVVEAKRAELGLDRPLIEQYGTYLADLAHGDLGESVRTQRPVGTDVAERLPASLELGLVSMLLAAVIGPGLALLEVLVPRPGPLRYLLAAGASAPIFLTGLLLLYLFWFRFGVAPGGGRSSFTDAPDGPTGLLVPDSLLAGEVQVAWDAVQHLLLPALALALPMAVAIGRSLRSSLTGVLREDYVRTARAKGLPEWRVIRRHALRNASTAPLAMAGLQVGMLFANLLVVERIFSWPGLGLYTLQALGGDDLTAVLGVSLLFGAAYIVVNALVDLAQAWADPRVGLH
jgi:peptide/nickel transport system permease protein/dipeptide transport system permease protein